MQDIALTLRRALTAFRDEAALKVFVARVAKHCGSSYAAREARAPPAPKPQVLRRIGTLLAALGTDVAD